MFGYKQHTLADDNGLVSAIETTAANEHDSKPMLALLDKAAIKAGSRLHGDKAYCSQKHHEALKTRGIKNGIQHKAVKNKPLTRRQLQRAWHVLLAVAYNLKRLPKLYIQSLTVQEKCAF